MQTDATIPARLSTDLRVWAAPGTLSLEHRRVVVAAVELAATTAASWVAILTWSVLATGSIDRVWITQRAWWLPVLVCAWAGCSALAGGYSHVSTHHPRRWRETLAITASMMLVVYVGMYFLAPRTLLPRASFLVFLVAATALTAAARLGWETVAARILPPRRVIIVGAGAAGRATAALLHREAMAGMRVVGFVDSELAKTEAAVETGEGVDAYLPVLGPVGSLPRHVEDLGIQEVLVSPDQAIKPELVECFLRCRALGVPVGSTLDIHEELEGRIPLEHLSHSSLVALLSSQRIATKSLLVATRRLIDVTLALAGLAVFTAVLPVIAAAIKLDSRGPVFYRQVRAGRNARPFVVWKLRTMVEHAEAEGQAVWASLHDPRVTRVGRFLRRTRLDEFPQLWNVLLGQMRLVGPRPERPELDALLATDIPLHLIRYAMPPGVTGWAQLRNGYVDGVEGAKRRMEYDLYYMHNQSLRLDLQIILRTIANIVSLGGR